MQSTLKLPEPLTINGNTYEVLPGTYSTRFEGDKLAYTHWDVTCNTKTIAGINDLFWGDGTLSASINGIRWSGKQDSSHFNALFHDPGQKFNTLSEALACIANKAEEIIAWRALSAP